MSWRVSNISTVPSPHWPLFWLILGCPRQKSPMTFRMCVGRFRQSTLTVFYIIYISIHIHTCFTYCLYLNRNKYAWYWNRQKGKLNFIIPWEDQVQRVVVFVCVRYWVAYAWWPSKRSELQALTSLESKEVRMEWEKQPMGMTGLRFFCTPQKIVVRTAGCMKIQRLTCNYMIGLQTSSLFYLWNVMNYGNVANEDTKAKSKALKASGKHPKTGRAWLGEADFFCAACSCGWIRNQPRWVLRILHPWITPGSSRHGCSVWETSPGSRDVLFAVWSTSSMFNKVVFLH